MEKQAKKKKQFEVTEEKSAKEQLINKFQNALQQKIKLKGQNNGTQTQQYRFMQKMQFEEVGVDYKGRYLDYHKSYEEKEKMLQDKYQEEMNVKLEDPAGGGQTLLEMRGDGFQNRELRSLTIAAYLRCLYGAIEFAPTIDLRNHAIQNIKEPLTFRKIT